VTSVTSLLQDGGKGLVPDESDYRGSWFQNELFK